MVPKWKQRVIGKSHWHQKVYDNRQWRMCFERHFQALARHIIIWQWCPSLNTVEFKVIHNCSWDVANTVQLKLQLYIRLTRSRCLDVWQDWYPMRHPVGMKARVNLWAVDRAFSFAEYWHPLGTRSNLEHPDPQSKVVTTIILDTCTQYIDIKDRFLFQMYTRLHRFKFKFSKIFWGGAHRDPSPDPSPEFSRAAPSHRASPSILGPFAPSTPTSILTIRTQNLLAPPWKSIAPYAQFPSYGPVFDRDEK